MDAIQKLAAVEAIKLLKARYFRGVDTGDGALVRSVLAEDCVLDYTDCFVDPLTGHDHFPALSMVMRGRTAYSGNGLAEIGVVSAHYGPNCEIEIENTTSAHGIWSMSDRLIMPEGGPVRELLGHGHYHETYVKVEDNWYIKTLRLVRTRVEAVPAA
ncbi:nuclear transport factor 2 family protein [Novosphingobium sp. M1R2S20]|uniref:Nuclear transport factor 2 family protein n=1 Tax=Novosphingobium rhizovicinum TaxID=3228928 RepID=A0ABV3RBZ2_9SPHN